MQFVVVSVIAASDEWLFSAISSTEKIWRFKTIRISELDAPTAICILK
jgi:hypothetical protein